jgi:hypothetical protein
MLYLHSVGVVHGDLSAYNVLLTSASPDAALAARGFTAKVSGACAAQHLALLSPQLTPVPNRNQLHCAMHNTASTCACICMHTARCQVTIQAKC